MWNGEIKVITGIRRCGKSVLLFDLFYEYLLSQGVKEEQIIRLELDQRRNYKYRNPITLCDYVDSIVSTRKDEKFYLFIDEVQFTIKVKDEENAGIEVTIYDMLNELKAYKNLDVYVTGSNSKMLSKDIATEFRGRATQIHVYPLSFDEFYAYVGGEKKTALDQYMLYGGKITKSTITEENAVNIAKDYLEKLGYENMTETYYMTDNNVCVINFAYSVSGVIYYSDLIKVGVSMNNGEVVSIEAKGFLVNHRDRAKFSADKTQEELQKNISPYLTVMNVKKCVIPKDNGTESNCYEFHCESNETNEEVLIYVNTDTGAEENILLLLYSDGGTLTK